MFTVLGFFLIIIIIIIVISVLKENNIFSMIASLPYGPPVNTDIDYYQTFFRTFIFVSVALLVVLYMYSSFLFYSSKFMHTYWLSGEI